MADERNFENARDLYRKARAAKSYGGFSVGGGKGTITETFGHREAGLPKTFTHVDHPEFGWQTFVGKGTPEIKKAQQVAMHARNRRPKQPPVEEKAPMSTIYKVGK